MFFLVVGSYLWKMNCSYRWTYQDLAVEHQYLLLHLRLPNLVQKIKGSRQLKFERLKKGELSIDLIF